MNKLIASLGALGALVLLNCPAGFAAAPELESAVVAGGAPTSGTLSVIEAHKKAKDGENILVEGRVREFVNGVATFSVLDKSIKSCTEAGEKCETPWDLCGNMYTPKQISEGSATVKVVGTGKAPIRGDVKGVNGLDHLTPVVVEGAAKVDADGNLTIKASKVYVKK